MSHHPNNVEYPDQPNDMPKDAGETFDLVVRKGPISLNGLMDQIYSFSQDTVYEHLDALRTEGFVTSREGDLEKDGTTRTVWEVHPQRVTKE